MPEQPPTLRDMIQTARDRGQSLRSLEARAVDEHGNTIGKDTIRKIANGEQDRMPLESQLRAIAAALGVPYERVRQAAINQWLPGDVPSREELIAELRELKATTSEALARLEQTEPGEPA